MKKILIEISQGIPEIVSAPRGVMVEIVDIDLLEEGDLGDITRYWESLSLNGRNYVKRHHPEVHKFVTSLPAEN